MTTAGSTRVGYGRLIRETPGNWFLLGNVASGFGDSLVPLALAFAILQYTGSVAAFGFALAAARLPQVVLTLVGGVAGDRWPARTVALVTSTACCLLNAASGATIWMLEGRTAIVGVVVLQILASSAGVFGSPAAGRVLREIYTDPARLNSATAFVGTTRAVTQILGVGASGLLVFVGSPAICFMINALSFAVFAAGVFAVRAGSAGPGEAGPREPFVAKFVEGIRAVGRQRQFAWALSNYAVCWLLIVQPFLVLTPAVLSDADGEHASLVWGVLGAAIGAGGIAGGLLSDRIIVKDKLTWVAVLALVDVPIFVLLATRPTSWLLYPLAVATGLQSTLARIWLNQELYRRFPTELTSRVQSLLLVAWLLPALVSSVVVSVVAEQVGLGEVLLGLAVIFVCSNAVMTFKVAVSGRQAASTTTDTDSPEHEPRIG